MVDIDQVLVSVGMGRYQLMSCLLFGLIVMSSNLPAVTYIFTAGDLKYRCEITECDAPNVTERVYEPEWLKYTTPYRDDTGQPRKCERYTRMLLSINGTRCERSDFDTNRTEKCRDHFVFENSEKTITNEFGLLCNENKWKLSMVGTVHSFGQFIGIPISGIITDKFGRKFTMVYYTVTSSLLYIIQSFSTSYTMFLVLEFLSSLACSGVFSAIVVLAMECVLPNQRVFYYSILGCFYPVGGLLATLFASKVKDWRLLLRISYFPGLLFLSYIWLIDESMRWLEMKGKHERVIKTLKRIATINKRPFPDFPKKEQIELTTSNDGDKNANHTSILRDVIRSPTIFWRMIRCSLVWMSVTLVYYGMTLNAVDIAGNKYLNFSLVAIVEIPANMLNCLVMEWLSRKMALSSMFTLSGITCVLYNLTPNRLFWVKLSLFMVGKLAISIAFAVVYILTAEIIPTQMRGTLVSMCSMFGRIGSMVAPQTTLLGVYFGEYMVMLVFGVTALFAATITMTLPESKNVKLPDTIDEAEQIGVERIVPENQA